MFLMMLYNNLLFVSNLRHEMYECTVDLNKILSESESYRASHQCVDAVRP